jgi:hypothetical protein
MQLINLQVKGNTSYDYQKKAKPKIYEKKSIKFEKFF